MIASIETPFAFLEKPVEMVRFDTVEFPHMTLCLVPEILNAVDMVLFVCKEFGVVDAAVMKV